MIRRRWDPIQILKGEEIKKYSNSWTELMIRTLRILVSNHLISLVWIMWWRCNPTILRKRVKRFSSVRFSIWEPDLLLILLSWFSIRQKSSCDTKSSEHSTHRCLIPHPPPLLLCLLLYFRVNSSIICLLFTLLSPFTQLCTIWVKSPLSLSLSSKCLISFQKSYIWQVWRELNTCLVVWLQSSVLLSFLSLWKKETEEKIYFTWHEPEGERHLTSFCSFLCFPLLPIYPLDLTWMKF